MRPAHDLAPGAGGITVGYLGAGSDSFWRWWQVILPWYHRWYHWARLRIKADFGRQGSFEEQQTNWSQAEF